MRPSTMPPSASLGYMSWLLRLLCALCATRTSYAQQQYEPNWGSLMTRPLPRWFDESKIGVFIHWSAGMRCTLPSQPKIRLTRLRV
eukprot:COSAG02_NODE_2178_length_9588_cov_5.985141_1_plen_86_part_00